MVVDGATAIVEWVNGAYRNVCSSAGTFPDKYGLARQLAATVMRWEKVPDLSLFRRNTAAFVHDLPAEAISNFDGDSNYVRVQVLRQSAYWTAKSSSGSSARSPIPLPRLQAIPA